ncbi:MAG: S9 family peptidase [Actinomycetota bacterium]|nr:S9 family peptidase [Actinomycetota bacterium]
MTDVGSPLPQPPAAPRRPHTLEAHGDERVDAWYWMADRDDPEVIAYLEAENAYTEAALGGTAKLQEALFEEMKARVVETDASAPSPHGPWWYWTRTVEGAQYRSYRRLADPGRSGDAAELAAAARRGALEGEEIVLDENVLAEGHDYFALGVFDISPDHTVLAYATDTDGSERYRLRFRDLRTDEDRPDEVDDVTYGSAWAADNRTLFYVRPDEAMRPWQVWRHVLGTPTSEDVLVHSEPDERFFVSVSLTRSERFVVVIAESKMTSEARAVESSRPTDAPTVILPRRQGVEYDVEHARWADAGDVWLVRTNAPGPDGVAATNFAVSRLAASVSDGGGWDDLIPVIAHRPEVKVEAVEAFRSHLIVSERAAGIEQLRALPLADDGPPVDSSPGVGGWLIDQPDPVFSLTGGLNAEWDADRYRFGYTSLTTPLSSIDYHVATRRRQVVRVQPVEGGYRPEDYRTERVWATAADGTEVPISLVARADAPVDGTAPCLLYGYGSYEITIDPTFSALRVNLLERGFTFAIAHVRGGGELGREWYEQGRLDRKPNTFSDFIACAEHLVATGWAAAGRLVIRGGSAGGLLMGAVTNERPDLWRAVVAEVPFVDVVTTMSDTSLPLTVTEWEEWGNPLDDPKAYRVMVSYSPYDNVAATAYPAMYVTGGLNDPRVGYWEPAKWVAKLRSLRRPHPDGSDRLLILRTEMGAGHQGASGRYDTWHDEARVQAFILTQVGIDT